jgi:hypothetical protein
VLSARFTNDIDAAADLETAEAAYGTMPPELCAREKFALGLRRVRRAWRHVVLRPAG